MEFKSAPDETSLPEVAFSQEELDKLGISQPEEAQTAIWQIGFDFALSRGDIPHYRFTSGVLNSIGFVATVGGDISARQPLITGFCEGSKQASSQDTVSL